MEMHYIQANIEVMIFTLICCENKTANSTGLKQWHLKALDDPLLHRCCHPMCERIVSCSNQGDNDSQTWIGYEVVETPWTIPWQPEHIPPDPLGVTSFRRVVVMS